jgi:hypothetical protein
MYFNVFDPVRGVGGFFRLGNRANEGRGEMTVCLYLPDGDGRPGGPVAFMFQRPAVHTNDAFDAAGLRFDVVTPFEELRVRYEGDLLWLDDPMALADPRAAFTSNPIVPGRVDLTFTRVSDPFGGEPEERHEREGEEFARGHYEQLTRGQGTIVVGDQEHAVDGFGLRDHSWGPRTWQAPWYYRWLTANLGPDAGFMASRIARQDRDGTRAGFVWEDGQLFLVDDVRLATTWGEGQHHRALEATLRSSAADRTWAVSGEVLGYVPLRNRRDGMVTRIGEGLTRWTLADGRSGHGWSEYLDQIIDDAPVGIDE